MAVTNAPTSNRMATQAYLLPVVVALGLFGILLRLWYLQIVRGEELVQQGLKGRTVSVALPAPRGEILDRKGAPLATGKSDLAIMVTPRDALDNPKMIARVCNICDLDPSDLKKDVDENAYRRFLPFVAKLGITPEQAIAIEEQRAFLPGVFVRPETVRSYPAADAAAHVVGYVGSPNQEDVDRLEKTAHGLPNFVGKVGLERVYDDLLLGTAGRDWVEVDSRGRQMRDSNSDPPIPGSKIILTLDRDLQEFASEQMRGRKGAVVALDPSNGEVLCLVSSPSFDPNLFSGHAPRSKIAPILTNPEQPMHNRASRSSYAPGSTFKIATLIGAIESGSVTPSTSFFCGGSIRLGSRTFRCLGHHGTLTYEPALIRSCNIFYAQLGRREDREPIARAATELGLGHKTGIDLVGESSGSIPTDDWLRETDTKWYPGDTINMSVGQGYVGATALQMAQYISTVANRGTAYRPHLLRAVLGPAADAKPVFEKTELVANVHLSEDWWDRIHRALIGVVTSGTARAAQIPGVTVAGKTGSSEHGRGKTSHGWFVAFAPAENPKIAIAVVLESGGHGGTVAAPVARAVMEKYLSKNS
jgi:penicillin-binding protein 2